MRVVAWPSVVRAEIWFHLAIPVLRTKHCSRPTMAVSSRFTSRLVAALSNLRCLALAFTRMRMSGFSR